MDNKWGKMSFVKTREQDAAVAETQDVMRFWMSDVAIGLEKNGPISRDVMQKEPARFRHNLDVRI